MRSSSSRDPGGRSVQRSHSHDAQSDSRSALDSLWLLLAAVAGRNDGSADLLSGPFEITSLRVFVENQTMAPFTLQGNAVGIGQRGSHRSYDSEAQTQTPLSFDITRDMRPTVRVMYRVRQFPQRGVTHDVTIVMSEPSAGAFAATTSDTAWIEVLSVQPLSMALHGNRHPARCCGARRASAEGRNGDRFARGLAC